MKMAGLKFQAHHNKFRGQTNFSVLTFVKNLRQAVYESDVGLLHVLLEG